MDNYCTHVYMGGNQKDLNTAYGMALRACGAGFCVGFYSFGELAPKISNLVSRLTSAQIIESIKQDLSHLDMLILLDIDTTNHDKLQDFIACKPESMELILCGTHFPEDVLNKSDLVSEIITL